MKKNIFFLCVFSFLSCKEIASNDNLYFEDPQPLDVSELVSMPNRFIGLYKNEDSTFLRIDKDMITRYVFWKFRIHKTELDSLKKEFDLVSGKWVDKNSNDVFEMKKVQDSLELSTKKIDTVFRFSEFQKAKSYKRDLILNFKGEKYWQINILALRKKELDFKYLSVDDLQVIDSITSEKSVMIDSSTYLLRVSKKEFRKIIDKEIGVENIYKKID